MAVVVIAVVDMVAWSWMFSMAVATESHHITISYHHIISSSVPILFIAAFIATLIAAPIAAF